MNRNVLPHGIGASKGRANMPDDQRLQAIETDLSTLSTAFETSQAATNKRMDGFDERLDNLSTTINGMNGSLNAFMSEIKVHVAQNQPTQWTQVIPTAVACISAFGLIIGGGYAFTKLSQEPIKQAVSQNRDDILYLQNMIESVRKDAGDNTVLVKSLQERLKFLQAMQNDTSSDS